MSKMTELIDGTVRRLGEHAACGEGAMLGPDGVMAVISEIAGLRRRLEAAFQPPSPPADAGEHRGETGQILDNLDWLASRLDGEQLDRVEECRDIAARMIRRLDAHRADAGGATSSDAPDTVTVTGPGGPRTYRGEAGAAAMGEEEAGIIREAVNRIVAGLAKWPAGGEISERYEQLRGEGYPQAVAARLAKAEFVEQAIRAVVAASRPRAPAAIVEVPTIGGCHRWHAFEDFEEAMRFVRAADRDGALTRIDKWQWHPAGVGPGSDAAGSA